MIVIANHTGGTYYLQTNFAKAMQEAKKDISVSWWHLIELEDRKSEINNSDVLRPRRLPDDERTKKYAATLKFPPVFRSADGTGKLNLFSSEAGRDLLEQQFHLRGTLIRGESPSTTRNAQAARQHGSVYAWFRLDNRDLSELSQ